MSKFDVLIKYFEKKIKICEKLDFDEVWKSWAKVEKIREIL